MFTYLSIHLSLASIFIDLCTAINSSIHFSQSTSIHRSIYLPVYSSAHQFICQTLHSSLFHPSSTFPFIHPLVHLPIQTSTSPSIWPAFHLPIHISICPFTSPFFQVYIYHPSIFSFTHRPISCPPIQLSIQICVYVLFYSSIHPSIHECATLSTYGSSSLLLRSAMN